MTMRTSEILALLLLIVLPGSLASQEYRSPSPYFIYSNSSDNNYDPASGILRLPTVSVRPTSTSQGELLTNVVLVHEGGLDFRLESADELPPEQECTRDEVNNAIPQLDLTLSLEQAESLIGCTASLAILETTLEEGRLVSASWTGIDGISNLYYGNNTQVFSSGYNLWRPAYITPIPVDYIPLDSSAYPGFSVSTSSFFTPSGSYLYISAPGIKINFREGVAQSYSYFPDIDFSHCPTEDFATYFDQVRVGMSYNQTVEILGCDGHLNQVRVSDSDESRHYSWHITPRPVFLDIPGPLLLGHVQISFIDDEVTNYALFSSQSFTSETNCSQEILETAYTDLVAGNSADELESRIACSVHHIQTRIENGIVTRDYFWSTQNPPVSILTTVNRHLVISTENNVITRVHLNRT